VNIKYYKIDAEILFSRSPFVKDEAKQFSYVKPYEALSFTLKEGATKMKVALPDKMKGKNMVIEVNSADKQ